MNCPHRTLLFTVIAVLPFRSEVIVFHELSSYFSVYLFLPLNVPHALHSIMINGPSVVSSVVVVGLIVYHSITFFSVLC